MTLANNRVEFARVARPTRKASGFYSRLTRNVSLLERHLCTRELLKTLGSGLESCIHFRMRFHFDGLFPHSDDWIGRFWYEESGRLNCSRQPLFGHSGYLHAGFGN